MAVSPHDRGVVPAGAVWSRPAADPRLGSAAASSWAQGRPRRRCGGGTGAARPVRSPLWRCRATTAVRSRPARWVAPVTDARWFSGAPIFVGARPPAPALGWWHRCCEAGAVAAMAVPRHDRGAVPAGAVWSRPLPTRVGLRAIRLRGRRGAPHRRCGGGAGAARPVRSPLWRCRATTAVWSRLARCGRARCRPALGSAGGVVVGVWPNAPALWWWRRCCEAGAVAPMAVPRHNRGAVPADAVRRRRARTTVSDAGSERDDKRAAWATARHARCPPDAAIGPRRGGPLARPSSCSEWWPWGRPGRSRRQAS